MGNAATVLMKRSGVGSVITLFTATAVAWNKLHVPRLASSLAFYALLSAIPLLISFHGFFGLFIDEHTLQSGVDAEMTAFLGPVQAGKLREMVREAQPPAFFSLRTAFSGIMTCITAAWVFVTLKDCMDAIWKTRPRAVGRWSWLRTYFAPLTMLLGFGFLLLILLLFGALLNIGTSGIGSWHPAIAVALSAANQFIAWLGVSLLFAALFRGLPSVRVRWRDVWLGAALAGLLFIIGKSAFSFYLAHSDFTKDYGDFGPIIAVVLWIYYSTLIFLTGALFTREQARTQGRYPEHQ